MDKKHILSIKNLKRTYGEGDAKTRALKGISVNIKKGEFLALSGYSGSGKSTTFHQISLLDIPTNGKIYFKDKNILELSEEEKSNFRLTKVGYIFQHYELLPEMTALENISLPLMVEQGNTKQTKNRAREVLDQVGLLKRQNHYPSELSGGEQQRISIARALVNNPEIILADEPTANLDSVTGDNIMKILKDLNRKQKITIFIINHKDSYEKHFDRIIRLKDGRIEKIDSKKHK